MYTVFESLDKGSIVTPAAPIGQPTKCELVINLKNRQDGETSRAAPL